VVGEGAACEVYGALAGWLTAKRRAKNSTRTAQQDRASRARVSDFASTHTVLTPLFRSHSHISIVQLSHWSRPWSRD
jgi:hypothetical protein